MDTMFNKYWLLLGVLPLAGCVTETRQETVMLHAPSVSAPNTEQPAAGTADPYSLQAAIATVRQQPWCYRKAHR
jgi:hypothetical protein